MTTHSRHYARARRNLKFPVATVLLLVSAVLTSLSWTEEARGQEKLARGALAYGSDDTSVAGRIAVLVAKILSGSNPAELPIERPTTFKLVANLKTAEALGLTVPQTILLRADEVIR